MDALKLLALDEEDLAIISAHLQDAVVKTGDMGYLPKTQRFALVMNRFDWDQKTSGDQFVRRRTGLHFERVRNVRFRGLDPRAREPTDAPSGEVTLAFSGGADIRFEVECIEARLSDLGPAWGCTRAPEHQAAAGAGEG